MIHRPVPSVVVRAVVPTPPTAAFSIGTWLLLLVVTVVVAAAVAFGVLMLTPVGPGEPGTDREPAQPRAGGGAFSNSLRRNDELAVMNTRARMQAIVGAMEAYRERNRGGRYPDADPDGDYSTAVLVEELERLDLHRFAADELGPHPYDRLRRVMLDGWGRPLRYRPFAGIANKS
ncbi:MAG: hypothetical protein AB7K09_01925, partial [Planctomycetota bacterium]